jgi:monofunctional biosynthetic peptidoglycan transglycosylase
MSNNNNKLLHKLKRWLIYSILLFVGFTSLVVIVLGFLPINTSAFMVQQHITDFKADKAYTSVKQDWIKRANISPHIFSAVVASEDQLFYQHHGFDFDSIFSALKKRSSGGKIRGASTISQQVAKNLFLSPSRSLWRKGFEVWFTLLIELFWSKERILLTYVNIAEFGDHLFGVQAASKHYFAIPAKKLSPQQAALLAASLPNPILFKVDKPTEYLLEKKQWILRQMRNLNYI